jgi:triosephosphate isomerase (TIM)
MKKKIVAGNWKMNLGAEEARLLIQEIDQQVESDVEIIVAPPSLYLESNMNCDHVKLASQNVSHHDNGAYTGEISASMLSSLGLNYCIVGHSERRTYYSETNEVVFQKSLKLLENKISPIFCCGELLEHRESGEAFKVVADQLSLLLGNLSKSQMLNTIIAYEPVWAIGTGLTASPKDAQEIHQYIRGLISDSFGEEVAELIPLLYGGSCKPDNAKELFNQQDIDGGLIGGASLKANSFLDIIKSF